MKVYTIKGSVKSIVSGGKKQKRARVPSEKETP